MFQLLSSMIRYCMMLNIWLMHWPRIFPKAPRYHHFLILRVDRKQNGLISKHRSYSYNDPFSLEELQNAQIHPQERNVKFPNVEFYSQLNTSGHEPTTCDTPVSHSIDIPTEELKILRSLEPHLPPTIPAPTRKHIDKATNIIYTHVNRHTDNEISEKE